MVLRRVLPKRIKNLQRSRQIANILIKHGFGHLTEGLGVNIPFQKKPRKMSEEEPLPVSARLALEELGPTFVKLGQILSMRPDLIPEEYITELKKLQDAVPSFGYEEVEAEINKEFGEEVSTIFESFDKEPLAAASISQVHRAVLNGEDVVVKVQRPRIEEEIEADISILYNIAQFTAKHVPETQLYDPVGVVNELAKSIRRELDFMIEARNAERFKKNFAGDSGVYFPPVFWEATSKRILTLEMVRGKRISELGEEINEEERKILAEKIAKAYLKQILIDGFFHGDPHPGNIFIVDKDVIAFIDFGIVGRVDEYTKEKLSNLLIAIIQKNKEKIVDELLDIGIAGDETSIPSFRNDIGELLDEYYGTTLGQVDITKMVNGIMETAFRHRIKIPATFTLLIKTILTMEAICSELSKDFNFTETAKPFVEAIVAEKVQPTKIVAKVVQNFMELNDMITIMPRKVNQILSKLQEGKLVIDLEHKGLNKLISEMDTVSNRISISLIISAVIVGSSLIVLAGTGPAIFGFPILGLVGYTFAGFLGLFLVISILRRGRF
jgi:ubiquinone biosynthesis protein